MKNRLNTKVALSFSMLASVAAANSVLAQSDGSCHDQASSKVKQAAATCAAEKQVQATKESSCCASSTLKEDLAQFSLSDYQVIERRANTYTYSTQSRTTLDADSDGNVMVVWGSRRQEQGTYGIFAQRFDPLGRPLGTELRINEWAPNNQMDPAIAYGDDDNAWVVWMSHTQDGDEGSVYARRFGTSCCGTFGASGSEFQVNESTPGHQQTPAVAVNSDGSALVTWTSVVDGQQTVMGRMFAADGNATSDEFKMSNCCASSYKDNLANPVALPNGQFAVAWARTNDNGDAVGIYTRLFDATGKATTDEVRVSADDARSHIEPSIDVDAAGRFVVAWMSQREDAGQYDVLAQRFDATGTPAGDTIAVADTDVFWQSGASVAVAPDGRFAVSYNEHTAHSGEIERNPKEPSEIKAKVFAADGSPLIEESIRMNAFNNGDQAVSVGMSARRMAWTDQGQLIIGWNGKTEEDGSSAAFTMLAPKSLDVPAPEAVTPIAAAQDMSPDAVFDTRALIPPVFDAGMVDDSAIIGTDGPGFIGFQHTGWTPPDPDIAAGPNHVVIVVNGGIRFYQKNGTLDHSESINNFWAPVGAQTFVFDPVAVYDHYNDRFVVGATEHVGSQDYLVIAMSDDNNPNGTWHKYRFNVDSLGDFIDYPNMGVDEKAVYICCDYFGSPGGSRIHIFDKSKMLNGSSMSVTSVKTSNSLRSLGATNDYTADDTGYFVTAWSGSSTRVDIDAIRDPLGSRTYSSTSVAVPFFSSPPSVPQKGTSSKLASIDIRTKNGVVRNGHLWTCHSIGSGGVTRVRWYDFDLRGWPSSGNSPLLNESGTLDFGSGQYCWMSDIAVDNAGNAVIVMSRSSSNDYAYTAYAVKPAGSSSFDPPVTLKTGEGSDTSGRWGDYAGIDQDPSNPGTFWTHNEYAGPGSSNWRTWVGEIEITPAGMTLVSEPIVVGVTVEMDVTGATPGGKVYFTYSLKGLGSTYIPSLDVSLKIKSPKLIKSANADGSGAAFISINIPNSAPVGKDIWLQAAEFQNATNVVEDVISN